VKVLLDTHALIWYLREPKKVPAKTLRLIERPETDVWFSTLSIWEITLKFSAGKVFMKNFSAEDILREAKEQDFNAITLSADDALGFANLPRHLHPDPFDRMLIWQAIGRELTLVSGESGLDTYARLGLKWVW
jgi:PIN domain nuclease of toxin-antitoxin system